MNWVQSLLAILLIFICGLLILVVLIQRGRGSGLAGAFGGGGGGGAFGAKTGDVLTWITVVVAAVFLLLAVVANHAFDQSPKPVAPALTGDLSPLPDSIPPDQPSEPSDGSDKQLRALEGADQPPGEANPPPSEKEEQPSP